MTERIVELDTRLDGIAERLARVEGRLDEPVPKTWLDWFKEWGGAIALAFTLAGGTLAMLDRFIWEPARAAAGDALAREVDARRAMSELSDALVEMYRAAASGPFGLNDIAFALVPKRTSLTAEVHRFHESAPGKLMFGDHYVLVTEFIAFGQRANAEAHARAAKEKARTEEERVLAIVLNARIEAMLPSPGHVVRARVRFDEAIIASTEAAGLQTATLAENIHYEWLAFEVVRGSCEAAQEVLSRLGSAYADSSMPPQRRRLAWQNFQMRQLGPAPFCQLDERVLFQG